MSKSRKPAPEAEAELVDEVLVDVPEPPPTVEDLREAKGTPPWLFAAARAQQRWPIGKVVSESEYDAAIKAAGSVALSSPTLSRKRKVS